MIHLNLSKQVEIYSNPSTFLFQSTWSLPRWCFCQNLRFTNPSHWPPCCLYLHSSASFPTSNHSTSPYHSIRGILTTLSTGLERPLIELFTVAIRSKVTKKLTMLIKIGISGLAISQSSQDASLLTISLQINHCNHAISLLRPKIALWFLNLGLNAVIFR